MWPQDTNIVKIGALLRFGSHFSILDYDSQGQLSFYYWFQWEFSHAAISKLSEKNMVATLLYMLSNVILYAPTQKKAPWSIFLSLSAILFLVMILKPAAENLGVGRLAKSGCTAPQGWGTSTLLTPVFDIFQSHWVPFIWQTRSYWPPLYAEKKQFVSITFSIVLVKP